MSPKFLDMIIWCCVLGYFASEVAAERSIEAVPLGNQTVYKNATSRTSTLLNETTRVQMVSRMSRGLNHTGATVNQLNSSTLTQFSVNRTNGTLSSALQSYLTYGFAGISGRAVNLENGDYKGEFLYLAQNATNRNSSVLYDGATLAAGAERLRESAWLWEFVPLPAEGNSSFYLRNKMNEQKPLGSKEDENSRWNYISLEIVSSPAQARPNQLLIYMKDRVLNHYYHANSTPNRDSALNGRDLGTSYSRSEAGAEWIVNFAS